MKNKNEKIEIIDTKDGFQMIIGDCVFNGDFIKEYEIKRFNGKEGCEVIVTFVPNDLKTLIDIKK